MTEAERGVYRDHAVLGYTQDMVRAMMLDETAARTKAERDYDALLADPTEQWRHVENDGAVVGAVIWVLRSEDHQVDLYLHDIEIFADHRGHGLGRAAMELVAAEGKRVGARAVLLNVWANNDAAQTLYNSMGFTVTNQHMRLEVGS